MEEACQRFWDPGGQLYNEPCPSPWLFCRRISIHPAEVDDIRCQVGPLAPKMCSHADPQTGLDGKFSVQYDVSVALVEGQAGGEQFSDAKVCSRELTDLTRKVKAFPNAAFDGRQAIITIRTQDGRKYEERTICVKRNTGNPMNWQDLERKFRGLTPKILVASHIDEVINLIMELERLADIQTLIRPGHGLWFQ